MAEEGPVSLTLPLKFFVTKESNINLTAISYKFPGKC